MSENDSPGIPEEGLSVIIDNYRYVDVGPRKINVEKDTYRILQGFRGSFHNWDWEMWKEDSKNGYNVANQKLSNLIIEYTEPDQEDSLAILSYLLTSWFGMAVIITFIPQITLSVRRLHDIGKSGWWYVGLQIAPSLLPNFFIFQFIAILTLFIFLYFMAMESEGDNKYGPLQN